MQHPSGILLVPGLAGAAQYVRDDEDICSRRTVDYEFNCRKYLRGSISYGTVISKDPLGRNQNDRIGNRAVGEDIHGQAAKWEWFVSK